MRARRHAVARRGKTETSRRAAVLEVVARTGDRTRKRCHPRGATFRVTRRYASLATVKTSGEEGLWILTSGLLAIVEGFS